MMTINVGILDCLKAMSQTKKVGVFKLIQVVSKFTIRVNMTSISGTIVYKNIGPGCWGIEANNGKAYRLINIPEQLKKDGAKARLVVKEVEEGFSVFMWGTLAKVVSFHTLST